MPRRARLVFPGIPLHVVQRGNNRQPCFFSTADYLSYLEQLALASPEFGCQIHAYALMTNHIHLLVSVVRADSLAGMMKAVGQRHTQRINRMQLRTGTLWEGRFRSCPVTDERYLLTCMRYIELNPVRAGLVQHPADYAWSSYRANAEAAYNPLILPHPYFATLGGNPAARADYYRGLFVQALETRAIERIRAATKGNFALADGDGVDGDRPAGQTRGTDPGDRPRAG